MAALIFVAVTDENREGKKPHCINMSPENSHPIVLLILLDVNVVSPHQITYHSIYSNGSPDETAKAKLCFLLGIGIMQGITIMLQKVTERSDVLI